MLPAAAVDALEFLKVGFFTSHDLKAARSLD
jgi:hypothetical protein